MKIAHAQVNKNGCGHRGVVMVPEALPEKLEPMHISHAHIIKTVGVRRKGSPIVKQWANSTASLVLIADHKRRKERERR